MRRWRFVLVCVVIAVLALGVMAVVRQRGTCIAPGTGQGIVRVLWSSQFGNSQDNGTCSCFFDSQGNLHVVGSTDGDLFGKDAGKGDVFFVKYDAARKVQWSLQIGSSKLDTASNACLDSSGNLYAVGWTEGAMPGCKTAGDDDGFLVKISPGGRVLWTRQFGTSRADFALGIAIDSEGQALISGYTNGRLYGTGKASGSSDMFLAKYDGRGNLLWGKQMGSADRVALGLAVATNSDGNIVVVGQSDGVFDPHRRGQDAFIAKFDRNGDLIWGRQFGSDEVDTANCVSMCVDGSIYVGGSIHVGWGEDQIGPGDGFVAKYASDGKQLWIHRLCTPQDDGVSDLALDDHDSVTAVGSTSGNMFGKNAGDSDAFLVKYSGNGELISSYQFGTSRDDTASSIAIDETGNVYVNGGTSGMLYGKNLGGDDAFVANLLVGPAAPKP